MNGWYLKLPNLCPHMLWYWNICCSTVDGIKLELKRLINNFQKPLITTKTIFARNYGTAAVISYNLKGIAPPVPPVQCWANKNLMSGCAAPTLKRVEGARVVNMYQEMVYYNRMHVKTSGARVENMYYEMVYYNRMHVKARLSQSILSKIVALHPLLLTAAAFEWVVQ